MPTPDSEVGCKDQHKEQRSGSRSLSIEELENGYITLEMSATNRIMVTAANEPFGELAVGLVESMSVSVRGRKENAPSIHVIDLGLSSQQIETIQRHAVVVSSRDIEIPIKRETVARAVDLSRWVRPMLPEIIPDFETYLWVDADAWVQNSDAVDWLFAGAERAGLAVVPELSPGYIVQYQRASSHVHTNHSWYCQAFGEKVAKDLIFRPVFNGGVWVASKSSSIWGLWKDRMIEAAKRTDATIIDQPALNRAIYHDQVPFYPLPSSCNWICCHALPQWNSENGQLVEPTLPHSPLGIVHITRSLCESEVELRTTSGQSVRTRLDYGAIAKLRSSQYEVSVDLR